jgi:glutamine phosphoribosylpyrophosphate amidotransferase
MCGILGYCAPKWDPSLAKFFGLQGFNLQHRGQENFGCTYSNGRKFGHFKDKGMVSQVFHKARRDEFVHRRHVGAAPLDDAARRVLRQCHQR